MREPYTLGERKLSDAEFAEKYFYAGTDLQYHTMNISDGIDERQQVIINNILALNERIDWINKRLNARQDNTGKKCMDRIIVTIIAVTVTILKILGFVIILRNEKRD